MTCPALLFDSDHDLRCNRNAGHYTKPHRATAKWVTSGGRVVTATVTWPWTLFEEGRA